jgi:putative membrane protein (TIGR04086 family)
MRGRCFMEQSGKRNIFYIFKGVIFSFICTILFLLIFSVILTYTNVSENTIEPVIMVLTAVSILIGSSIGNIKIKKNGIVNGALIGGIYLIIIYLISSIINSDFSFNLQSIIVVIAGIICGMIGGIIGVNKKI